MYFESEDKAKAELKRIANGLVSYFENSALYFSIDEVMGAVENAAGDSYDIGTPSAIELGECYSLGLVRLPFMPGMYVILFYEYGEGLTSVVDSDFLDAYDIPVIE